MPVKLKEFINLLGWPWFIIICVVVILDFLFLYQSAIALFSAIVGASTIAYTIITLRHRKLTQEAFTLDFLNNTP